MPLLFGWPMVTFPPAEVGQNVMLLFASKDLYHLMTDTGVCEQFVRIVENCQINVSLNSVELVD